MTNSEKSAEERVKEKYPDAFAWLSEDGIWFISLPHLGEADAASENAEQEAWADAASRLEP